MIGKLFDILKPHKRAPFFGQCRKARGSFPDVQKGNRFKADASPSHGQRLGHHIIIASHYGR